MSKVVLTCTHPQFEGLHATLDKVRATSKTVTVDKAALTALLIDHGRALSRIKPEEIEQL